MGLFLCLPAGAVLVLELKAKGKQLLPPPSSATCLDQRPLDPGCAAIVLEVEVRAPSEAAGNPRQRCRLVERLGCRPRRLPRGVLLSPPRQDEGPAQGDAGNIVLRADRAGQVERLLVGCRGLLHEEVASVGAAKTFQRPHTVDGRRL